MRLNYQLWLIWLLTTGIAGGFIRYMGVDTDFFWELIASGFVVGIAQWIVLRPYIKSLFWWIPLSGFGWILGIYLMIYTGEIFNPIIEFLTGKETGYNRTDLSVEINKVIILNSSF